MIGKRTLWFTVGVGVGVGAAVEGQRRVRRVMRRASPGGVLDRTQAGLGKLGRDVQAAWRDGRVAMRTRESELRARGGRAGQHGEGGRRAGR